MQESPCSLWIRQDQGTKRRILSSYVEMAENHGVPPDIVKLVALNLRFRLNTVRSARGKQLGRLLSKTIAKGEHLVVIEILFNFFSNERSNILEGVYDSLGIEHEDTELAEGATETAIAPEAVDDAVDEARLDQTGLTKLCLESLHYWCPAAWKPAIADALTRLRETEPPPKDGAAPETRRDSLPPGAASEVEELGAAADTAKEEDSEVEPTLDAPQFTTLDRLLIRAVVSALNDVHGALDEDELDDLVQEVLELNDMRAQSFFHRGFVDSLLDRPLQPMGPGENHERRAWYLAGYIQGAMRREGANACVRLLREMSPGDDEVLLGSSVEAGAFLLPSIIGALVESNDYDLAIRWLERHVARCAAKVVPQLIRWARMAFLATDPDTVARVLELCREQVRGTPAAAEVFAPDLADRLDRRLAIAYRLQGKPGQAEMIIDDLLASSEDAETRAKLLGDKLLLQMGLRSLEDLRLGKIETRDALDAGLDRVADILDEAIGRAGEVSPITNLAIAVRAVLAETDDREVIAPALDSLSRAIADIESWNRAFWTEKGVLPRARFYRSLLELRMIDEPALAAPATDRLIRLVEDGLDEPLDLILDAVKYAVFEEVAQADRLARVVLSRWPQATLSELDLKSLVCRGRPFREKIVEALEANEDLLNGEERWAAWRKLLEGALSADERDIETARRALDELETLAVSFGFARELSELLETRENWDPAWEPMDAEMARFHVLESAGEVVEARAVLVNVAHQAITDEAEDSADLVDMLEELGAGRDALENLRLRINAMQREEPSEKEREQEPPKPVSIVFFGGDERQAAYEQRLLEEFSQSHPGCSVEFEFNCWSSNWARRMDGFENKIEKSNAIIVMRLMRTELGRKLRKAANESGKRWIPCTGRGLDSMRRSIENAISVARRQVGAS